jgi:hypothetical protein
MTELNKNDTNVTANAETEQIQISTEQLTIESPNVNDDIEMIDVEKSKTTSTYTRDPDREITLAIKWIEQTSYSKLWKETKGEKRPKYDERTGVKQYLKDVVKFIEKKATGVSMLFILFAQKLLEVSTIEDITKDGLSRKHLDLEKYTNYPNSEDLIIRFTDNVIYVVRNLLAETGFGEIEAKLEDQQTLKTEFGKAVLKHLGYKYDMKVSFLPFQIKVLLTTQQKNGGISYELHPFIQEVDHYINQHAFTEIFKTTEFTGQQYMEMIMYHFKEAEAKIEKFITNKNLIRSIC